MVFVLILVKELKLLFSLLLIELYLALLLSDSLRLVSIYQFILLPFGLIITILETDLLFSGFF